MTKHMDSNDTGIQDQNIDADKTQENDEDVVLDDIEDLDEDTSKKFKTLDAQRKSWRDKAVDPETGKTYKELLEASKKVDKTPEKNDVKEPSQSDLDYGQKAFLVASGIKGEKEMALVKEFMSNTGKSLDDVVESKFFQSELKELRDSATTANAVPKGSKRSGSGSKDSVEYWLAAGKMPEDTPENSQLRREIVEAKYKRETSGSPFTTSKGIQVQSKM